MVTEERAYELVEPITFAVLERAAKALGTTATDILEKPQETLTALEPSIDQQQAFCEAVLEDFDLRLTALPVLEGRAFFTVVFRSFFLELSGLEKMLSAVLRANGITLSRPDGDSTNATERRSP